MMGDSSRVPPRAPLALFAVAAAVLAIAAAITIFLNSGAARKELEAGLPAAKSRSVSFRAMIMSRSDSGISARCRFYDQDGYEIAVFERFWNGSDLIVETVVVPVGDRRLLFPSWLDTELPDSGRGTELYPYYERNGFPAIYDQAGLDGGLRSALSTLFAAVRQADVKAEAKTETVTALQLPGGFAPAARHFIRLRNPEVGRVYALVLNAAEVPEFRSE